MMNGQAERKKKLAKEFGLRFGGEPSLWCRAPGRVDLMGSHTDYNLGYVLTLPIGYDTWIAARPREDNTMRLHSLTLDDGFSCSLDRLEADPVKPWSNYLRGVACQLRSEGLALHGFDGVIHSTVPISSGLSSSAALECATATVFEALGGWKLDPVKKALICQRAENRFVGVNCGILDQYTSCAGKERCALLLDCRDLSSRAVVIADGISMVICDTKFKRELAGSEYGRRRAQCEEGARRMGLKALRETSPADFNRREQELPPEVARRCRFIVEENDRVLALAEALASGNRLQIGKLCADSFCGAKQLYEIVAPAMEAMMDAMLAAPGVIGARQAGAGFGGCMLAVVDSSFVDPFAESVRSCYQASTGRCADIYPVAAAAGAGTIDWIAREKVPHAFARVEVRIPAKPVASG